MAYAIVEGAKTKNVKRRRFSYHANAENIMAHAGEGDAYIKSKFERALALVENSTVRLGVEPR